MIDEAEMEMRKADARWPETFFCYDHTFGKTRCADQCANCRGVSKTKAPPQAKGTEFLVNENGNQIKITVEDRGAEVTLRMFGRSLAENIITRQEALTLARLIQTTLGDTNTAEAAWANRADKAERALTEAEFDLQAALAFLEHPEFTTVQVGSNMVPRDVWLDEATKRAERRSAEPDWNARMASGADDGGGPA